MNPGKRSQLGAHYTSREDILLVVEPVVVEPLQRRWEAVKAEATALAAAAEREALAEAAAKKKGATYPKLRKQLQDTLFNWVAELSSVRILDPACGSGNFLYLALRRLLDLWHEVRIFSAEHGLPTFLEKQVHPSQLYGLDANSLPDGDIFMSLGFAITVAGMFLYVLLVFRFPLESAV